MSDIPRYRSDLRPERKAKCMDYSYKDENGNVSSGIIETGVISDFNLESLTGKRTWDETHPAYFKHKRKPKQKSKPRPRRKPKPKPPKKPKKPYLGHKPPLVFPPRPPKPKRKPRPKRARKPKLRHVVGGGPYGHWEPIRWDYGGPFWSLNANAPDLRVSGIFESTKEFWPGGPTLRYSGGFVPSGMGFFDDPATPNLAQIWSFNRDTSYGDPSPYGAEAWNRFKPKLELLNLPQILYELREVPSMLKQTSEGFHDVYRALGGKPGNLMGPTGVSEQFLNYQFGWLPFLKDMSDLYKVRSAMDRKAYQNRRDNNRIVRRRGTLFAKHRIVSSYGPTNYPEVYPGLHGKMYRDVFYSVNNRWQLGASWLTLHEFDKVTFSAAFKYNIPQLDAPRDDYHKAFGLMRTLGIKVSPSTVYKVVPWSWLVDWFSNLGDIVDNFESSALDGLTATYAYIMRRLVRRITHRAIVHLHDGQDVECFWTRELDSKRREKANPFGFGLSYGDLSVRQLAILTALGLTRK